MLALILLLPVRVFPQEVEATKSNLSYPESINIFLIHKDDSSNLDKVVKSHQRFRKLIHQLRKKKEKKSNEAEFLRSLFYHVHEKRLHFYDKYSVMHETLNDGTYGCLTGTALYAIILSTFDIDYNIIELPNHVFIQVIGNDGFYIFESTLPFDGFKKLDKNIVANSKHFSRDMRKSTSREIIGSWYATTDNSLDQPFNIIGLRELAGLQYFNEAIKLFSRQEFEKAIDRATDAYKHYPSKRNKELMQLIINKIIKHQHLTNELRDQYLNHYVSLVKKKKLSQTK